MGINNEYLMKLKKIKKLKKGEQLFHSISDVFTDDFFASEEFKYQSRQTSVKNYFFPKNFSSYCLGIKIPVGVKYR